MPMEDEPAHPEDDHPGESEKPRFLLPDGCKDLIDALRLQGKLPPEAPARASLKPVDANQSQPPSVEIRLTGIVGLTAGSPKNLPASVTLSDPITVRELATALHLKPFHVIGSLMELN